MMNGLKMRVGIMIAILACCASLKQVCAAEDKIVLFSGKTIGGGQVTKDEISGVEYTMSGGAIQSIKPEEVKDIEWDAVNDWQEAEAPYKKGSYGQAVTSLRSLMDDKDVFDKLRNQIKPRFYFMLADSLLKSGKVADATPVFKKYIADFPKSRYVPDALSSQIEFQIACKNFEIKPLLSQLGQLGVEQQRLADCLEGEMLRTQGNLKKAELKFSAATSATDPRTKIRAMLGQAGCALEDKNPAKAREFAQRILIGAPTSSMAAAAHLIMGDAMMFEAETNKLVGEELQNKLTDALLEYMRVQLQYPGDPNTEPQSLFKGGVCLQRMSKLPNHATDRQRAYELYGKLTSPDSKYRNTVWAEKANEQIKAFK